MLDIHDVLKGLEEGYGQASNLSTINRLATGSMSLSQKASSNETLLNGKIFGSSGYQRSCLHFGHSLSDKDEGRLR